MRRQKIFLIAGLFVLSNCLAYGRTNLYIFGKGIFARPSGAASDYVAGTNDFPFASSFTTYGLGLGIEKNIGRMFLGVEAAYNLGGKTTLRDPSDNDTVKIDTYRSVMGLFILGVDLLKSSTARVFVNLGMGMNAALDVKTKTYTSKSGCETKIEPPESKSPFAVFGGLGLAWNFSSSSSVFISGRYQWIDSPQTAFVALCGLQFSF